MPIKIVITPGGDIPLYRQIADRVRQAIHTGKAAVGDPLPSVRALAEELVVNPNTVLKAFNDLVREGLIEAQAGRGFFIAARRQMYSKAERERRLRAAVDTFVGEVAFLDLVPADILALVRERLSGDTKPEKREGNP